MKKSILWTRKGLLSTLLILVLSTAAMPAGTASATPAVTQTNPETTVYLDPATIVGETVGQVFTVDLNIINAHEINGWESGLIFNATLLTCTGFSEGEFLSDEGFTSWTAGTIDNTKGEISLHICNMLGVANASGNGRLAYLTFQVKATGVSDLHIRDLSVFKMEIPPMVPVNIIDVYTVLLDAASHTVVTVSNTTGSSPYYHSGFYGHAFSTPDKELSFKVTGPFPSFANVTIPKTLLESENESYVWGVIIDGSRLSAYETTVTENATHTSIYFTYTTGIHSVQITPRIISSTVSITLSSTTAVVGSSVTISGRIVAADATVRPGVNVTIQYRPSGVVTWTTLATIKTDLNGNYSHTWTPETVGTYEFGASWEGGLYTLEAESEVLTLDIVIRDLVVSLDAPTVLLHGESSLLNATVYNAGTFDETDVVLQLLIDGEVKNSTVIPLLQVGLSHTISYGWTTPIVEAMYEIFDVTAYAPPKIEPGVGAEDDTINNVETKFVEARRKIDLVVSLDAPTILLHGESSLLNATVRNSGTNNETDVVLQLLIDGEVKNSTVIPLLQVGLSHTISYGWTTPIVPEMYKIYNVTAYAPPLTDENVTINNVETKFVEARRKIDLVVSLDAPTILLLGRSSLLNATVRNSGTNNETDVELQLLIDGEVKNSTVIPLLQVGLSHTISYNWTPIVEAMYEIFDVTAYAPPLTDENVTINNVETKLVMVGLLVINPFEGPIGKKATVHGGDFTPQSRVNVTFNDVLVGYATTDKDGYFNFTFNIPLSAPGNQTVKAFDGVIYRETIFTVIDETPLDIEIDVGTIYFRGESAEFNIQIAHRGKAVNPTSIEAWLYKPDGTKEALTPQSIAEGFYKVTYPIPRDAPNGTYALVIEAIYDTGTVEPYARAYGTSFKTFLLSPTLTDALALIDDLKRQITAINATLTDGLIDVSALIDALKLQITAINATLTDVLALVDALKLQITAVNATVNATLTDALALIDDLSGEIEDLEDDLGDRIDDVWVLVDDLKANLTAVNANVNATLTDELALISAINATLQSLNETISQLETRIDTIKGAQEAFTAPLYGAMVLALIAAVGAILSTILLRRKTPA